MECPCELHIDPETGDRVDTECPPQCPECRPSLDPDSPAAMRRYLALHEYEREDAASDPVSA